MTGADAVSRDDVELEIWRLTGARDAERVDALLAVIDGYVGAVAGARALGALVDRTGWAGKPTATAVTEDEMRRLREDGIVIVGGGPAMQKENPPGGGRPMRKDGHVPFSGGENASVSTPDGPGNPGPDDAGMLVDFDRLLAEVRAEAAVVPEGWIPGDGSDRLVCARCRAEKSVDGFARDVTRKSGRRRLCRMCEKAARKALSDRAKGIAKADGE